MLTAKQEGFCLGIAKGLSQSDAYRAVVDCEGLKPDVVEKRAARLAKHSSVVARIGVLRGSVAAAVVQEVVYSVQDALREADEAAALAHTMGQASAAVAAVTLKAKLTGHLVEKKEILNKSPLDGQDTVALAKLRDEINERIARANEAAELIGGAAAQALPPRRLIA